MADDFTQVQHTLMTAYLESKQYSLVPPYHIPENDY